MKEDNAFIEKAFLGCVCDQNHPQYDCLMDHMVSFVDNIQFEICPNVSNLLMWTDKDFVLQFEPKSLQAEMERMFWHIFVIELMLFPAILCGQIGKSNSSCAK